MKVVVLAGGRGTRLGSLTSGIPKPMLLVKGKPVLEHIILGLKDNGFKDIIVAVDYLKEKITEYFGNGSIFGVSIKYVEKERLGSASSVAAAEGLIDEERFLTLNGDVLFDFSLLREIAELKNCDGVISAVKLDEPRNYGVLEVQGRKVLRILEKPETPPTNLVNAGVYVLPRKIFSAIKKIEPHNGEYYLTDAIEVLLKRGILFYYYLLKGQWFDIGTKRDLERANTMWEDY